MSSGAIRKTRSVLSATMLSTTSSRRLATIKFRPHIWFLPCERGGGVFAAAPYFMIYKSSRSV